MGQKPFKGKGNTLGRAEQEPRHLSQGHQSGVNSSQSKTRTQKSKAAAATAAAAAERRLGAWDKRLARGKAARDHARRQADERLNSQSGGTAKQSAVHMMKAASFVENGAGNTYRHASTTQGETVSEFSSTLLNHHRPVDQCQLDAALDIAMTSSIARRNKLREQEETKQSAVPPAIMRSVRDAGSGKADVDLARALLLSHEDASAAKMAAGTVRKILQNIQSDPSEKKYHKIRLKNQNIQKRLCFVGGALQLLFCGGFTLVEEHAECNDPNPFLLWEAFSEKGGDNLVALANSLEAVVTCISLLDVEDN